MPPKQIYGLGSCRVLTPLKILERQGLLALRHHGTDWYTHSTQDTLQKIDLLTGQKPFDQTLARLISPEPDKLNQNLFNKNIFQDVDTFIIEISSIKSFKLDGTEVQQWCVRGVAESTGITHEDMLTLARMPIGQRNLTSLSVPVDDLSHAMAERGILIQQGEVDLSLDLIALTDKLIGLTKPKTVNFVFVPAINRPGRGKNLLPERVMLCKVLDRFCRERRFLYFDPAPLIAAFGDENALVDLGHYTKEFEPILATHLYNAINTNL